MAKTTLNVITFSRFTLSSKSTLRFHSDADVSMAEGVHVSSSLAQRDDHEAIHGKLDHLSNGLWENSPRHS